ncbi:hypothetical protein PN36_02330 [Candidatus Thiomargarita nelsonii]|uniref:ProQ/FinO domain-containing protein n=1 Tax=Candidatus Thiomargarita nelsonii TaxID=1003181 RepID=A0A4E0QSN8_9GAMM|nr:hypothetical protein PN36_02330 [Candidatus Thiomargarita nelsonii]
MNLDKKGLNKLLREVFSEQYEIEKFLKTKAKEKGVETGYHIIYSGKDSGEQSVLTTKPLGENLQDAKAGLESWLASNPTPFNEMTAKQRRYFRIKAALEFLCATYPKCFIPHRSHEKIRAFAIGLGKTLFEAVKDRLPEGMVLEDIKNAMRVYCNFYKYNIAKSKVGNPRINLEGEVVSEVTEEEVELFLRSRKKEGKVVQKKVPVVVVSKNSNLMKSGDVMPNNQSARIEVQSLKITLPLKSEQVPRDILPEVGTPGTTKMKLFWDVVLVGQAEEVYRVGFSVKNYRKCLNTLAQHDAEGRECIVLLQGKLVSGGVIEDGGLSVQVKKARD